MSLREELADAEATAAHLRRRIAAETCATAGHDWRHIGGRNACCERDDEVACSCSVPVQECAVCGDSDYGDNQEAADVIRACAERRAA